MVVTIGEEELGLPVSSGQRLVMFSILQYTIQPCDKNQLPCASSIDCRGPITNKGIGALDKLTIPSYQATQAGSILELWGVEGG